MPYPTPDQIAAAADLIAPHIRVTPTLDLAPGTLGCDAPLTLKLEHLQTSGSFKLRGAFYNMLTRDVPAAGVVAASGGNHGAAVACAATALGHRSKIFVPRAIAKEEKLQRIRDFGAEVVLTEGSVADCITDYAAHAEESGALSVHPYDTLPTLTGQGTVARELEQQMGGLDTVLVATGGGGLIGGVASWFQDRVRVVSVETELTNTLERSLREGPEIDVAASGIAAGSLGGPRLGLDSFDALKAHVDAALLVDDSAVFETARRLWDATRLVVEPGGAVALAALTTGAYRPTPGERVAVILCGGNAAPGWFLE